MKDNKFNNIFNKNPYVGETSNNSKSVEITKSVTTEENTSNKSIFVKKDNKEKKMFYIKTSSIKKIEKIAGKYNLNLSEVLDIIIEDFNKY